MSRRGAAERGSGPRIAVIESCFGQCGKGLGERVGSHQVQLAAIGVAAFVALEEVVDGRQLQLLDFAAGGEIEIAQAAGAAVVEIGIGEPIEGVASGERGEELAAAVIGPEHFVARLELETGIFGPEHAMEVTGVDGTFRVFLEGRFEPIGDGPRSRKCRPQ